MTITVKRSYPRVATLGGDEISLRLIAPGDQAAVLAFAQKLSEHDLMFLRRDISEPKVVDAWVDAAGRGLMITVLALKGDKVVGSASIYRDPLTWSSHVGELRVLVSEEMRGKGLGRKLTQEIFAVAMEVGLEKIVAHMTIDQRGAIAVFEALGFRPEALMHDHVKDRKGQKHDIVIFSHDVGKFASQMEALGMREALSS